MIKMPLIPLLHVFLEDKQLDDDVNDLRIFGVKQIETMHLFFNY